LKQNEEAKIYVQFSIPQDAENKTYSVDLEVFNNDIKQDKIFGFTINSNENATSTAQNSTSPAGNFILPKLDSNIIYITIFAIFCFSTAIILKKIKIRGSKRDETEIFLFDIKNYFEKRKGDATSFRGQADYKKIVASAFPNALKDVEDKYGKNN
jgi:ribosomal protein S26